MKNNFLNGKDWPSLQRLGILRTKKRKHFEFNIDLTYLDIPNLEIDRIYRRMFIH